MSHSTCNLYLGQFLSMTLRWCLRPRERLHPRTLTCLHTYVYREFNLKGNPDARQAAALYVLV
jgi:hypothetical protein